MKVNPSANCVCCGKHFDKVQRTNAVDLSKEWFIYAFKKGLLKLFVDQQCFMRIYHDYQRSLTNKISDNKVQKVDMAVQTEANHFSYSSVLNNPRMQSTTESYPTTASPAKRRALLSSSLNDDTSSHDNSAIELPLFRVPSSKSRCCVCGAYYTQKRSSYHFINESIRCDALVTHKIMIREGSTCCTKHINNNCLSTEAITAIKNTNANTNKISSDELMHSFQDISREFKRIESILDETSRQPANNFR